MKKFLSSLPGVRVLFLKLLKATAFDLRISNPWTQDALFLNSYRHKGYWYFGRCREERTMATFQRYIDKGDTVIEIGGHIGFITQYFMQLVGDTGKVIVFEPGANNRPYIEQNLAGKRNVLLETKAISNRCGIATFYEDNITGQNNSLLSDYRNARAVARSHRDQLHKTSRQVELITIDHYLENKNIKVDFIKIDIEGCELQALQGMTETLKSVKAIMVEVTENHAAVSAILSNNGYELRDEEGHVYSAIPDSYSGNVFATKHD